MFIFLKKSIDFQEKNVYNCIKEEVRIINFKKYIATITTITLLFNIPSYTAEAVSGRYLKEDLSNCTVNYSEYYAQYYGINTMRGATAWHSSNYAFTLNWSRTFSSDSTVNCFTTYDEDASFMGITLYYSDANGNVNPHYNDWNNCIVLFNYAYDIPLSTYMHEFGHVMGLDDNNSDKTSIMCQYDDGRTATKPSDIDRAKLNFLYYNRD